MIHRWIVFLFAFPYRHSEIGWYDSDGLPEMTANHAVLTVKGIENNQMYGDCAFL